ncbi:MAG: hypothetical protein ACK4KT_08305 [Thermaurantimonas sp.]
MKTIVSRRSVNFLNKSIAVQAAQLNSSLALHIQQLSMGNLTPLENYLKEKLLLIDDSDMRQEVIENFFSHVRQLIQSMRHRAAIEGDFFEAENLEKCTLYLPILERKFSKIS